jgi:CRP-like cAMP-binding protein
MFEVFQKYISDKISISDEDYQLIQSVCAFKKLRKRQYLLQEGDVWKYNAFVAKGFLRNYRLDEKGLEHILSFAPENWWAGDRESLLTGNPAKSNIDALEDSEVILIGKDNFEMLCRQIPEFNNMVNAILNKSFIVNQNRIHAAISFTAEQKYIMFMEKYADLSLRIPQSMIASFLGITPETLSRIRKETSKR